MTQCGEVVDKYIEFDPIIISLDAMLLKKQAFRHVFNNSGVQAAHWKLTIILLLCDAYTRLVQQHSYKQNQRSMPDYMIYSALEWELYWNFLLAFIELIVTVMVIVAVGYFIDHVHDINDNKISTMEKVRGLLLSNFGKILVLPAILWGSDYSYINLMLSHLFVFASNVQALRVMCPGWKYLIYIFLVGIGHSVAMITTRSLQKILPG